MTSVERARAPGGEVSGAALDGADESSEERDDIRFYVLDPGGKPVTVASFARDAGSLCFRECPHTRGRLIAYFFLDCRRDVMLELDGRTLRGTLTTFWNGRERIWRLQPAA